MKRSTPLRRTGFNAAPRAPIKTRSKKQTAKNTDSAALAWLAHIKAQPCAVCARPAPSDAHHIICDRYSARRPSHRETIPLCKACHQDGPLAIHNGKASWVERNGPDWSYLPRYLSATRLEELGRDRHGKPTHTTRKI